MDNNASKTSLKAFLSTTIIILTLMIVAFILANTIKGGEYVRDAQGLIVTDSNGVGKFNYVDGGIPFWKWILSPFLVLGSDGGLTIISIIAFLLVIGGVFEIFKKTNLFEYLLKRITNTLGKKRTLQLFILSFFFMLLGSLVGAFEEVIPLVPIVCGLMLSLGYDKKTGIVCSLLAVGCGFACSILNPFSIGVAQKIAGVVLFSGIWLRIVTFIIIYSALMTFIMITTRKNADNKVEVVEYEKNDRLELSIKCIAITFGVALILILCSMFITALQDYTIYFSAVAFLLSGIETAIINKLGFKTSMITVGKGIIAFFPAVILILMSASIKYTLSEAHVIDSMLHGIINLLGNQNKFAVILYIYLIILIFNFMIPSSSAKAFMIIPLVLPVGAYFGVSAQCCILAYIFGDGFSNIIYPTNPALLITLNLTDVKYTSWFKHTILFQITILIITASILLFAVGIGY